jgi:hypothetical protein
MSIGSAYLCPYARGRFGHVEGAGAFNRVDHAFLSHTRDGGFPVSRFARLCPRSVRGIHEVHASVFFDGGQFSAGIEHESGVGEIGLADLLPRSRGRIRGIEGAARFDGVDLPLHAHGGDGIHPSPFRAHGTLEGGL